MLAENPKKRKRPLAKDWPPTSTQKKTLLPYTKRFKLPRLNEAPFMAVWMKIIGLALEEKKECCRKLRYFRAVHQELSEVTNLLLNRGAGTIRIRRNHRYYDGGRLKVTSHSIVRGPVPEMELLWLSSEYTSDTEILVWIYSLYPHITYYSKDHPRVKYLEYEVTDLPGSGGDSPQTIRRFTDIYAWENYVCAYLNGTDEAEILNEAWPNNKSKRLIIIEKLIRLAPKRLDRLTSKTHICKLIDENQAPDQESSSSSDNEDWLDDEEFGSCHDI